MSKHQPYQRKRYNNVPEGWLPTAQVANLLVLSYPSVRTLMAKNNVPHICTSTNRWFFDPVAVQKLVEERITVVAEKPEDYVTMNEACELFGCMNNKIYYFARTKRIRQLRYYDEHKQTGRRTPTVYCKADLLALLKDPHYRYPQDSNDTSYS